MLAYRIQRVISDLVDHHQACRIRGLNIQTHAHVSRRLLECCDAEFNQVTALQHVVKESLDNATARCAF